LLAEGGSVGGVLVLPERWDDIRSGMWYKVAEISSSVLSLQLSERMLH
jgi:hypothetical protein